MIDTADSRLAENSRASYPLRFLSNTKQKAVTKHPKTIIFLTADANGVLPPIAKLTKAQATLWFLMGYTSKLAGTELGVTKPKSSFSRFFGAPFMPCLPHVYAELFRKKLDEHGSEVFLINTGWTGGPYGIGKRFDIAVTRKLVDAALDGTLNDVPLRRDERFKLAVPMSIPGVANAVLDPASTWENEDIYNAAADTLAAEFATQFDSAYGNANLSYDICEACPGR